MLKKMSVSKEDVQKLVEENRILKHELQRLRSPSPMANGATNEDYESLFAKLKHQGEAAEKYDEFNDVKNMSHDQTRSETLSIDNKILNGSVNRVSSERGKPTKFALNGEMILSNQYPMFPSSEVTIRIKGKNSVVETKKGFVDVSNEERQRQLERVKQKQRALERLKDLERIQNSNKEKLQNELDRLDGNYNGALPKQSSVGAFGYTKRTNETRDSLDALMSRQSDSLQKQMKRGDDYSARIRQLERDVKKPL
eukprot:TRINITY_DN10362_c0_g3_i1.p2 TRINITY_DN10362_c0_g3~~TRINITY_DN10362_c0_g3_i1.p2  ORF type:complete len:254 (-),score=55.41 TRINITY_DN10362_c0_g3_i1:128-889(-)